MGIHDKTPASLEIFGEVSEELLDMILVTSVYIERTRAQRERDAVPSASATSASSSAAAVVAAS